MRTKYTLTQDEAIKVYTNKLSDVVTSSQYDIKIIRATDDKERARLVIFKGRSAKPIANYFYNSYDAREQAISRYKVAADARKEYKEKKKAEKKALGAPKSEVGAIFCDSWGYEQTNINYFQVIERPSTHFAIIQEIASERIEGTEGHDCCHVRPVKNEFSGKPFRVKISKYGESEYIKVRGYSSASLCKEGETNYCSWYY